tara:strand:+ start:345 stop:2609 length:2265 start_codon:yes stop_codon:yes gene_type:complete
MTRTGWTVHDKCTGTWVVLACLLATLAGCGGGGGNARDSGADKTTLRVESSDPDGHTLNYDWRVTAGTIDNRNARETVWTLPAGPGLHFAYVVVSDGQGGYTEAQYAVSSDAINNRLPAVTPVVRSAPAITSTAIGAGRLRLVSGDTLAFATADGAKERRVYLPDAAVEVHQGGTVVFSGTTDLSGEIALPHLEPGSYALRCATVAGAPLTACGGSLNVSDDSPASVSTVSPTLDEGRNLRLYGHIDLADGSVCGSVNDFFALQRAATVQLLQADGTALAPAVRVNRYGDYALDAAVAAQGRFRLKVACEGASQTLDVPAPDASGYRAASPVELAYRFANHRPAITQMIANGPDGNVRGQRIEFEEAPSAALPGPNAFLAYKGGDTRNSACAYYTSIGAAGGCDAQGGLKDPITLEDWKRQHKFKPYDAGNAEVSATYVNRMDLNLVRRMLATQTAADRIAFVVCNHPGPEGASQRETDAAVQSALDNEKQVACVAMEWSTSPGVNSGKPFTKFLTFGPDGGLLPSINLDGRGEKYMPGACVACHGGTRYSGRFDSRPLANPQLGAAFLPFDTGNYLFASQRGYSEAEQGAALKELNRLVAATDQFSRLHTLERLYQGWYTGSSTTLDKGYVPEAWRQAEAGTGGGFTTPQPGATKLYREVVGGVCRTCHAAMGADNQRFNFDSNVSALLGSTTARDHFCGGSAELAVNASMPNALASRNRLTDRINADPELAELTRRYLGCVTPLPDPAYARR